MDDKQQQLQLELELLLLHLALPIEEDRKQLIASQAKGLLELYQALPSIAPDMAALKLNELLKKAGYAHQFKFLTDATALEYTKNNPAVYYLFSVALFFLAAPLKTDIDTRLILKNKEEILKHINSNKLTTKNALHIMKLCRDMLQNISEILEECKKQTVAEKKKP